MKPTRTSIQIGTANTLTEYDGWMKSAGHGDVLVYHVGDLASDRTSIEKLTDEDRRRLNVINAVANRVMDDVKAGQLVVFQRRIEEGISEYLAMRVKRQVGQSVVQSIIAKANRVPELA